MTQQPLTDQQLDDIEQRTAHLHEYVAADIEGAQPDFDKLTGEDVAALLAEIRRQRAELAATRTKTLALEADAIVAHCPDHGPAEQPTVWMDCHCAVADDMRRRAAAAAASGGGR